MEGEANNNNAGHWHDDSSDICRDTDTCCLAIFCPCHRWAMTMHKAQILSYRTSFALYGGLCFVPLFVCILVTIVMASVKVDKPVIDATAGYFMIFVFLGFGALLRLRIWGRRKLREKYRIPGDDCSDYTALCYSPHWTLAQEGRHVDAAEPV